MVAVGLTVWGCQTHSYHKTITSRVSEKLAHQASDIYNT